MTRTISSPQMSRGRLGGDAGDPGHWISTRLRLYGNPLRQALSASTWRAAWYLLAYQLAGWALFSTAVAAAAAVIRGCANAERSRLRAVLGEPVEARYRDAAGPGVMARARSSWADPATWRDVAYLVGMFVPLGILGSVVLGVWLTLAACITLPLWYWAPFQRYPHGVTVHGVQLGYFPHGPSGPGGAGVYVDTLPKALLTSAACLVLFALFSYVLVLATRLHASVARALLRPSQDSVAHAADPLRRPRPGGSLPSDI